MGSREEVHSWVVSVVMVTCRESQAAAGKQQRREWQAMVTRLGSASSRPVRLHSRRHASNDFRKQRCELQAVVRMAVEPCCVWLPHSRLREPGGSSKQPGNLLRHAALQ